MKIEAFYEGIKNANEAVNKLKSEGINAYTDLNDHLQFNTARNKEVAFLTTPSNADLVLNSGNPSGVSDKSPLLAASPMVSGMGGFEEIADVKYKVIVETDSSNKKKAEDIIKSSGGSLDNPNLDIQKHIKDIDFSKADPDFMKTLE